MHVDRHNRGGGPPATTRPATAIIDGGLPQAQSECVPLLATYALALECILLAGFVLPFSIRRLPFVIASPQTLAKVLGTDWEGALRFVIPVVAAFLAFAAAIWLARRTAGRAAFWLVLGGTTMFSATLLTINPVAAHDVYHNVADSRTFWVHSRNPAEVPPGAFLHDPLAGFVPSWLNTPSAYGPVWYVISGAPLPLAGDSLWGNVVGQKAITAIFLIGTTALAMLIMGRIRPAAAITAGVLVGWNPLLQFETAGNGHNDVVMVFFALAAIYALSRRWWVAVFPLLVLSVASKQLLIVLGPALLIWLLRRQDVPRRQIALSLALAAAVAVAVYAPVYSGIGTFTDAGREANHVSSSPGALLHTWLWRRFHTNGLVLVRYMRMVLWPPFLVAYAWLLARTPQNPSLLELVERCFWVLFLLIIVVTWWFMPWYLFWLVPFGALVPRRRTLLISLAFSVTAMLLYVPHFWLLHRDPVLLEATTAATAFLIPLLIAIAPGPAAKKTRPRITLATADRPAL